MQRVQLQIKGAPGTQLEGESVSLAADSLNDTNSLEQPQKLVPHVENAVNVYADAPHEFPPYSITVLKLKSK